jgi:hypothetical protein
MAVKAKNPVHRKHSVVNSKSYDREAGVNGTDTPDL